MLDPTLERFSDALHAPRLSPPFAKGGKSAASGLFSPLAKGGHREVLRVPLRCARFGIQAIETPLIFFSTKVIAESCVMLILHIFMQLEHRFRRSFLLEVRGECDRVPSRWPSLKRSASR